MGSVLANTRKIGYGRVLWTAYSGHDGYCEIRTAAIAKSVIGGVFQLGVVHKVCVSSPATKEQPQPRVVNAFGGPFDSTVPPFQCCTAHAP